MTAHFRLYSKEDCHLCHDMHEDLRLWQTRLDFQFETINIDGNFELEQQYGHMIPVLTTMQNQLLCFGRLDPLKLKQN